jgi:hypothetical protein
MDAQRQQELWANAIEHAQAVRQMARQGRHNVSVACSYSFQEKYCLTRRI